MGDTFTKTLPKRIPTKHDGVYYKEIEETTISGAGKSKTRIIDKVYSIRYREKGKERFITLGKYSEGIREAYCKTKRNEYMTLAKNGELPPQIENRIKQNIVTLDSLAERYFADKSENKTNEQLRGKYNLHLGCVTDKYGDQPTTNGSPLGRMDIHTITKDDIAKIQKKHKGKLANKTVNSIVQLLSAIINHSIREYDLNLVNPCIKVKRFKIDDARERFLSIEEVHGLLKETREDPLLYMFTRIALSTGARLEGVLHIQKKDIDTTHNKITIKDLKNDNTYSGFFDDVLKQEIKEAMLHLSPNDYYIGGRTTPYPSRSIRRKMKPILDRLFNNGLDAGDTKNRVVIHTLRHTFASQLAIKGIPLIKIKKLMNHAKIEMTERYAKLAPDSGRDVVEGLYDA